MAERSVSKHWPHRAARPVRTGVLEMAAREGDSPCRVYAPDGDRPVERAYRRGQLCAGVAEAAYRRGFQQAVVALARLVREPGHLPRVLLEAEAAAAHLRLDPRPIAQYMDVFERRVRRRSAYVNRLAVRGTGAAKAAGSQS
jgi:hypothetical protein